MRPSTVQTSRFSFFSRDVIFAFAPWSTASTCAIESFQRKPKGGINSATEYACAAESRRGIMPVEKIRHIALPFRLKLQFAWFSILVSVARILIAIPVALRRRENCLHGSIRSNRGGPLRRYESIYRFAAQKPNGGFFVFHRTRAFLFSSQENFC